MSRRRLPGCGPKPMIHRQTGEARAAKKVHGGCQISACSRHSSLRKKSGAQTPKGGGELDEGTDEFPSGKRPPPTQRQRLEEAWSPAIAPGRRRAGLRSLAGLCRFRARIIGRGLDLAQAVDSYVHAFPETLVTSSRRRTSSSRPAQTPFVKLRPRSGTRRAPGRILRASAALAHPGHPGGNTRGAGPRSLQEVRE
jgi:hypothetical protein